MRIFRFDKLVRDKIADNIIKNGGKVNLRTLSDEELLGEAKSKLLEEVQELQAADKETLTEEFSDISELIDLLCKLNKISAAELNQAKVKKAKKSGVFEKKIFIETVEVPQASEWVDYYLSHPDKYPEVEKI